jgi:hypothetical protein
MRAASNTDRILAVLRVSSVPLDDDQLARQAGISPRQTVNQLCRRLEQDGVVRRYVGSDGKIVNTLIARAVVVAPVVPADAGEHQPPGNSLEQRAAERVMLDALGEELGLPLDPLSIPLPSGERVTVDGADSDRTVLVECWAHQGAPKPAQKNKVLADAFKLSWIGGVLYPRPRRILCLSDPEAAAPFLPSARSWAARALQDLGIEVRLVRLPDSVRDEILAAQRRQFR